MTTPRTLLWHRLVRVGQDACRQRSDGDGRMIDGTAPGLAASGAAHLSYSVSLDSSLRPRSARGSGCVGPEEQCAPLEAKDGRWTVNGTRRPDLDGAAGVDLRPTPATDTFAIRRTGLSPGNRGVTFAAWLDHRSRTVRPPRRTCVRRDAGRHGDTLHDTGFSADPTVEDAGFVTDYPSFWRAVA